MAKNSMDRWVDGEAIGHCSSLVREVYYLAATTSSRTEITPFLEGRLVHFDVQSPLLVCPEQSPLHLAGEQAVAQTALIN